MIQLRVLSGPEKDDSCCGEKQIISLGRAPTNDLVFSDQRISWNHAQIRPTAEPVAGYLIRDLNSRGGTLVRRGAHEILLYRTNDERLLEEGDEITLAQTVTVVQVETLTEEAAWEDAFGETLMTRLAENLPEIEERVATHPEQLKQIVDFDRIIGKATSSAEVIDLTVNYLTEVFPKCLYVAAIQLPEGEKTARVSAAGEFTQHVRVSQTIASLAQKRYGIRYQVKDDTLLTLARDQWEQHKSLSPHSVTFEKSVSGLCVPVIGADFLGCFLQTERVPLISEYSDADLDLLMIFAARVGARLDNINAMEKIAKQQQFAMAGVAARCIAHDLGNAVQKITGVSGLLQEGIVEDLPKEQLRNLYDIITYGAGLTSARCRDFIALGHSESPERVNVYELAQDVATDCTGVFGEQVAITVVGEKKKSNITAKSNLIARLFWNLFDNAYKVVREDKTGQLRMTIEVKPKKNALEISVCDDIEGGMPQEEMERFQLLRDELFAVGSDDLRVLELLIDRMDDANIRRKQGYGIGSFFMCMAVRDMKGTIEVESGQGGTRFVITLPTRK